MSTTEIKVVLAEAVVVGPDDRLVIHVGRENWGEDVAEALMEHLKGIGLEDRSLVLFGDEIKFAKVSSSKEE